MPGPNDSPSATASASTAAGPIDLLFAAITLLAIVFTLLIVFGLVFFVVRYRRGNPVDRSNPPQYNTWIEIAWTFIPLAILIGLFVWSAALYLANRVAAAGASEIYVVGKQWMWKIQHPEGRWEMNELHVPVGKPVVLVLTSQDVIHAFYVPAFRLKVDVIPGEYTRLPFTPTKVGTYHLFCAEFCGTLHSRMTGVVRVMEQADYEAWLRSGSNQETLAAAGQRLFIQKGCNGCHSANSSVRAPILNGIYGTPIPVQIPRSGEPLDKTPATTVVADDRYLHDAIVLPEKEVAAGFKPIMPTFKNRLSEDEIFQLIAYIKSLSTVGAGDIERPKFTGTMSPEEYRARVGFTPENLPEIRRLGAGAGGNAVAGTGNPPNVAPMPGNPNPTGSGAGNLASPGAPPAPPGTGGGAGGPGVPPGGTTSGPGGNSREGRTQ